MATRMPANLLEGVEKHSLCTKICFRSCCLMQDCQEKEDALFQVISKLTLSGLVGHLLILMDLMGRTGVQPPAGGCMP